MNKRARTAIEAVAGHFSVTWKPGSDPPDAYLVVAGKRVAVDTAALKRRGIGQGSAAKPGLRFDKVVTRLMERLKAALNETVPAGVTVLLTVTAPIRLPSKTAGWLEDKIQALLKRAPPGRDAKDTVHGNRVQIRILRHASERAPKIIGLVHNSDSDALLLLSMTSELLERIGPPGRAGDRWLVLTSAEDIACLATYRSIYSQFPSATDYKQILIVFADGRVETLK